MEQVNNNNIEEKLSTLNSQLSNNIYPIFDTDRKTKGLFCRQTLPHHFQLSPFNFHLFRISRSSVSRTPRSKK